MYICIYGRLCYVVLCCVMLCYVCNVCMYVRTYIRTYVCMYILYTELLMTTFFLFYIIIVMYTLHIIVYGLLRTYVYAYLAYSVVSVFF